MEIAKEKQQHVLKWTCDITGPYMHIKSCFVRGHIWWLG